MIKPIRNPFTGRDNFPDFDEAITSSSSEWPMPLSSSTRDIRSSRQTGQRLHRPEPQQQQHHQSFESAAVDVSMCSHASLSQLSIGARACLNEHLRHVAKFGLDDSLYAQRMDLEDHSGGEADHVTGSSRSSRKQRDPRDLLWEKLVDAPAEFTVDQDYSGSSDIIVSPVLDEDLRQYYDTVFANSHGDVQQDVEVMAADQSTDFFNSSRVWLLTTPDRNRAAQIHAVTSRQSHPQQESLILDESFTHSLGNDGVELGTIVPHMFPPPPPTRRYRSVPILISSSRPRRWQRRRLRPRGIIASHFPEWIYHGSVPKAVKMGYVAVPIHPSISERRLMKCDI